MNFKNSTRSISLVLMAVALMSVTSVHQDVFAKDSGMSLTAIAEEGWKHHFNFWEKLHQT